MKKKDSKCSPASLSFPSITAEKTVPPFLTFGVDKRAVTIQTVRFSTVGTNKEHGLMIGLFLNEKNRGEILPTVSQKDYLIRETLLLTA